MNGRRETLATLAADLVAGRTTSVALTELCLDRIADSGVEGARTFLHLYRTDARAAAAASDQLRTNGIVPSPLAGIPISIKDLFDVAGEATTAGAAPTQPMPHAARDALVVQRLRAAGAVLLGRTNMTEFAYSTLGLNPHHGTPGNPFDPTRIPGGSSSGAAAAVAHDFCVASIGSDTAGSVRIPAAFCGITGFKPTQRRVPREGMFALSPSLDSVGPLGASVACCALLDSLMAGEAVPSTAPLHLQGLRLAVPKGDLIEALDPYVARAFARAFTKLSAAGASVFEMSFEAFTVLQEVEALGGLAGPEAARFHRERIAQYGDLYDPRIRARLEAAGRIPTADYLQALELRARAVALFDRAMQPIDALVCPTVAVTPPRFSDLETDAAYLSANNLIRRNAAVANLVDGCALTLPCGAPGELPVGLMLMGRGGTDARLLSIGLAVERALA